METRRRGRWPALQLPPRLAVSPVAFPAPAPCTDGSRPAPEGSLPDTEGSVPHPTGSRRPLPRSRPVGCSAARRPRALSGPWTGPGPPSGRGAAGSPLVLRPRPDGPREGWSSLLRPHLHPSPPFPQVTGLGAAAAAAAKPRGRAVGTGHGLAPFGAHSNANTPARVQKSFGEDVNAAEGLF